MGRGCPVDTSAKPKRGRWGESEIEKGPVNLFPAEPTDEARKGEETLNPWVQVAPRLCKNKRTEAKPQFFYFSNAEDGT